MTTKELKNKIDKVLGNSVRCLLPSYWWKKLFNDVIDKIDNTLPIVDSQEKLNNLDIPNGGIASVCTESKWRSFNECYEVVDSDIELPEEELLNKLTKIYGIKVTPPSSPMLYQTIIIMLDLSNKGLCLIGCGKDEQFGDFATISFDVAGSAEQFILMQNGIVNEKTVKKVNEILNTAPILYLGKNTYSDGLTDEQWNEFTSVFSWLDLGYSDVYVKNDSWEKLVKENMLEAITNIVNQKQDNLVSGSNIKTINGYSILGSGDITVRLTADSEMSNTSINPVQNKVITKELYTKGEFIYMPRDNMEVLSDQRKDHNRQVYSKLITCYNSETSIPFPLHVAYSQGHGTLVEMRSIQSGRLDFNNNTWLFSSAISPIYRYSSVDPVANYRGDSSVFRLYSDGNVTIESTISIHDSEAITAAALNDLNERLRQLEKKINE